MTWPLRLGILLALLLVFRWTWGWFWRSGWKRMAAYFLGSIAPAQPPAQERRGQLKRDPVCGTHVDTTLAIREEVEGQVRYFCSEQCRRAFREGTVPVK